MRAMRWVGGVRFGIRDSSFLIRYSCGFHRDTAVSNVTPIPGRVSDDEDR
jgi:hypothetical protein